MLVLLVASALRYQPPSVVFEQPDELAELHVISSCRGTRLGRVPTSQTSASGGLPKTTSGFAQYPLADCRRDALQGTEADVAAGEDSRDARLEEVGVAVERPPSSRAHQNGSYEIRITSRKPLRFSGTFTRDDGVTGTYTGTWASHFDGDGCCGAAKPPPPTCTRTYVVEPGGARIHANVKNTELTEKQVAAVLERERGKYEGWDYEPIGEVTRKVNCAGFVMLKLFGRQMVDANVDPDPFFRAIVKPFGSKRLSRVTARAGDVVVWRSGGVVKHVAFVEAGGVRPTILTKDQNERLYRMKLALDPRGEELLAQAHGSIEFWRIDRTRVRIAVVDGEDCGK